MNKFLVSATPHIKRGFNLTWQNLFLILAMLPILSASIIFYKLPAFLIFVVAVVCCYIFDIMFSYIIFGKFNFKDISSIPVGLMLASLMPVNISLVYVVIGAFVSIFVAKIMFGGMGKAVVNESALGAIVVAALVAGFTSLCVYTADSGNVIISPLEYFSQGKYDQVPLLSLFLGSGGGLIGTTSIVAILIGGIFLMLTGVYNFYVPILSIVSFIIVTIITKGSAPFIPEMFAGSFLFVSFFMLPSHSSSPTIWISKCLYAIIFGVMVALTRQNYLFGEAGVVFCLVLANLISSALDSILGIFYHGRRVKKYE